MPSYRGSMTVEASIILPFFLFFFINLMSIMEIYRLHSVLCAALYEVGNELTVYAYAYDAIIEPEEDTGIEAFVESAVFSYLYVKQQVEDFVGGDYLEHAPLKYGADGLIYLDSSILQTGDVIDLVVSYQVRPFVNVIGYPESLMYNRYYGRAWTGFDVEAETETDESLEYVYVAQHGEVYHVDRDCTYISLRILPCNATEVRRLRNEYGEKYTACEICITGREDGLYVTPAGNRYHGKETCGSLYRNVTKVPKEEALTKYKKCSRCGG